MAMMQNFDVIIVGAGAAGLGCAEKLIEAKKKILIIEARNRIGGRAFTVPASNPPIDLGAEFIHSNPKIIMNYLTEYGLSFYDVLDSHLAYKKGRLVSAPKFWDILEKYKNKMSDKRKHDQSIRQFLSSAKFQKNQSLKMFQSFVEGFHAADINKMGEKGFLSAEEITQDDELNQTDQFRITNGYTHLWEKLVMSRKNFFDQIRFDTVVKKIDYSKKNVEVLTKPLSHEGSSTFKAPHVVVTVPLGVLKSDVSQDAAIHWAPEPPSELTAALQAIEMGHIQKVVFHFRSRFWEQLRNEKITFMHAGPEVYFPTWWTFMPLRVPYLTAWQGGPKAFEMAQWDERQIQETALKTLSTMTKKSVRFLEDELVTCYHHNWSKDPFTLGAYSYVLTNGLPKAKAFSKSTTGKIYFAGEATIANAARGTVHGALESGEYAAQQILKG
jgi:monoamine oxidase